jgi:DNA (cytosine-5)-methyltransferase 1
MTHLSLFTGIGGLDLAAEWAGFETVGQCEWADYPTKVLEKHWPDVPRWRDVHDLTAADFTSRTGLRTVDCISGGFPCQPHSVAGKRQASADERDLWPEYRRIVSEIKPRWVVAENVPGLLSSEDGRFFRGILRDFAEMGFDVGWATISAASVGAVHRRERMAIIAHACGDRLQGRVLASNAEAAERYTPNLSPPILQRATQNDMAESAVCGSDVRIPARMDRLKCLGNAVVPQQFYPIFKAIAELEGI